MNVQISTLEAEIPARVAARSRSGKGRSYVYIPGSPWSHLKFGLGTLAVIVIPPLIPGVTGSGLVMGYMSALVGVFTVVCLWGMVRSLSPPGGRR